MSIKNGHYRYTYTDSKNCPDDDYEDRESQICFFFTKLFQLYTNFHLQSDFCPFDVRTRVEEGSVYVKEVTMVVVGRVLGGGGSSRSH